MLYIEIPKTVEATQVFKLEDHKAIVALTAKYDAYIPVMNGAFALLQTGYYDINFVMPGDYIIEDNCDPDYPYTISRKKYFELGYKKVDYSPCCCCPQGSICEFFKNKSEKCEYGKI